MPSFLIYLFIGYYPKCPRLVTDLSKMPGLSNIPAHITTNTLITLTPKLYHCSPGAQTRC